VTLEKFRLNLGDACVGPATSASLSAKDGREAGSSHEGDDERGGGVPGGRGEHDDCDHREKERDQEKAIII
jgi:hypothetical protein